MTRSSSFYVYVKSKPIPGFEKGWFAREDGSISSPWRKNIRGSRNKDGYPLYIDPGSGQHYVHRLVAKTFVHNARPDIFTEVDHVDGCKYNNCPSNLRWANRTIQNLNRNFKGWSYSKRYNKYKAHCVVSGVKYKLGWYKTSAEAHKVYVDFKNKKIQEIYAYYLNGARFNEPLTAS